MLVLDRMQSWGLQGGVWENIQTNKTSGINMDTHVQTFRACPHVKFLSHVEKLFWDFMVLAYLGSLDRKYAICVSKVGVEGMRKHTLPMTSLSPWANRLSRISLWQLRYHCTACPTKHASRCSKKPLFILWKKNSLMDRWQINTAFTLLKKWHHLHYLGKQNKQNCLFYLLENS